MVENPIDYISSRIPGFEGRGDYLSSGGFDFFPARDKVRPVRALDEHLRQNLRDQFARRILVKQGDRIDGLQRQGDFDALILVQQRPERPLHAPHAGIRVQGEDQNVAHGAAPFEQPDMARVKQVVAAVGEDHGLAVELPAPPLFDEFRAAVKATHRFQCSSQAGGGQRRAELAGESAYPTLPRKISILQGGAGDSPGNVDHPSIPEKDVSIPCKLRMLKAMAEQSIHGDGNIQVLVTGSPFARVELGGRVAAELWIPRFRAPLDPARNKDLDLLLPTYAITDLAGRDDLWESFGATQPQ